MILTTARPAPPRRPALGRVAVTVAAGPALAGYALAVAVLAGVVALAGGQLAVEGLARAAGAAWLAAHQVPLLVGGAPLGALPLLPTALLGALVAWTARRSARRAGIDDPADVARLAGVVVAAHAGAGAAIAAAISTGDAAVTASPVLAALGCGVVAAVAAACGLTGWVPVALARAPQWCGRALSGGALALTVLVTGGLAAVLAGLVGSLGATRDAFGAWGPAWGAGIGLALLSIAYLPNAAVAGASWLAGPGLSIGAFAAAPTGVVPGPVPAVPLLAALPDGPAAPWWPVVFVVPLLAGVAVGFHCAGGDRVAGLHAAAGSAGVAAVGSFALALLASGRLGGGPLDPVHVPAGTLAAAVAAWVFLPAVVVVCVGRASGTLGSAP